MEKKIINNKCPYCGSREVRWVLGSDLSYCNNCRKSFETEGFIEPEKLKHILGKSEELEEFIRRKDREYLDSEES